MRVFFSEPDGSTWMEELPTTHCGNELRMAQYHPNMSMIEYRFTDLHEPAYKEKRYKFKGMSYVEGKGVMFYDRIEEP